MMQRQTTISSPDMATPLATVQRNSLPTRTVLVYSVPQLGMGFMFVLTNIYLLKYTTDVLLIAPATMGLLFGASRIWDAVSDPMVGYLTDRTHTRMGRRRPWMLAGALPMALAFGMLWSPPAALTETALILWMGVALIGFYTAMTMVDVPHSALGAELSDDYHERTRVFGVKRIVFGIGTLGAVASIGAFDAFADARAVGSAVALIAAGVGLAAVLYAVVRLRERAEYQGRGAAHPWNALRDVLRNRHARLLLAVWIIQQLGVVALTVCLPFLSEYVLLTPEFTVGYIGALFLSSLLGVPFWMAVAPRFEKKNLMITCMALIAGVISLLVMADVGDVVFVMTIAVVGGFASGGTDILGPSIQADIVDYDEEQTGERKEGAYFAAWAFASKTAGGLSSMIVGLALGWMAFVPNAVQTEEVRMGLRALTALVPAALYALGVVLFLRFDLSSKEHARIRGVLHQRNQARR
jgi:GPH family glycoside/pentoside/hexuronide:cation symporter